jgi:hypothetical protein
MNLETKIALREGRRAKRRDGYPVRPVTNCAEAVYDVYLSSFCQLCILLCDEKTSSDC